MDNQNPMISVSGLSVTFKNQQILKQINVDFYVGNIYGIIGRNGSGKTVLLKCICGLLEPSGGTVYVNNKKIGKDIDFPERTGFIIETPGFLMNYSGFKNLRYLASIRGSVSCKDIEDYMTLVGLDPAEKKQVRKYSMGMRQRLGIAQAIMEDPDILILDEPMNRLDEDGIHQMRELFLTMKAKGKLIILTSHYKEDIQALCDKVYKMKYGELEEISMD